MDTVVGRGAATTVAVRRHGREPAESRLPGHRYQVSGREQAVRQRHSGQRQSRRGKTISGRVARTVRDTNKNLPDKMSVDLRNNIRISERDDGPPTGGGGRKSKTTASK